MAEVGVNPCLDFNVSKITETETSHLFSSTLIIVNFFPWFMFFLSFHSQWIPFLATAMENGLRNLELLIYNQSCGPVLNMK